MAARARSGGHSRTPTPLESVSMGSLQLRPVLIAAVWWTVLFAGCTAGPPDAHVPRGEPPLLDVWCPVDPFEPLQATCRLVLTEPVPVEIEVTDGTETALFATDGGELEPVVPVWGLTAESAWDYVARAGGVELG